jgi:transposase
LRLFCEPVDETEPVTAEEESVEVPAHLRAKRGRRPLPENLPRVDVIHDLNDEEKVCPNDGSTLELIGEDSSGQLDIVPAKVQVIRHIRRKYACPCCEQQVKTAPLPPQPIPKSIASPGMLAHVATSKYVDALPLYRQETIFQRLGVDIPRATFANWMIQCGQLIQPLINLMREQLLAGTAGADG